MSLIYVRESSEPQRQGDKTDTYNLVDAWSILCYEYKSQTPAHIKVIDAYLLYVVATGILQLLYIVLVRGRPYQYFVTGLFASFGSFFLAANVRCKSMEERPSMINESNLEIEQGLKSDRPIPLYAIAEFLVGHVVLNTIVANLFTVTL